MGGSCPNSDFNFFLKYCVFCVFFILFSCFQKKIKKLDRGVGEWGLINPSFSQIFGFFFNLTKPLSMTIHSKHKTFVYLSHNVGTTSKALGRHCTNVIRMFCLMGGRFNPFYMPIKTLFSVIERCDERLTKIWICLVTNVALYFLLAH